MRSFLALSVSLLALSSLSCASHPTPQATAKDATTDLTNDATAPAPATVASAPSSTATTTAATKESSPKSDLLIWLNANVPKGGSVVEDANGAHVMHVVTATDTHATLASAYIELADIYAVKDFEKALQKKIPNLTPGAKIEIPNILAKAPKDPKDDRLGWPEDKALRVLFITGGYAAIKWTETLDRMVPRGLNAVILDAKDYMGPVNYPTKAKIALETGAAEKAPIPNLARAIRFAHDRGIRVILRIPCFHDPVADKKLKDSRLSIRHSSGTVPLHMDWIDPTNVEAQDYAIELAKEGVEAGADEINLDYVRFPVHVGQKIAKLPDPKDRSHIIRDFVKRVHAVTKPNGVMLSLDLFGVTATGDRGDIEKLGQDIATVGPEAEAIMPMVYPSHYDKGYNGWEKPGDHPEIVGIGTKGAVKQLQAAKSTTIVRSWLQAFPWRVTSYGPKYVVDQAKSAEANGGVGWAMWSPGCEYSAVWNGFPPKQNIEAKEQPAPSPAKEDKPKTNGKKTGVATK